MSDVSIRQTAVTAAPLDYKVPGAQEILPKAVSANMDGTSALVPWFPCLQLLDPAGNVMFSAVAPSSQAAGASADVTWFPGLISLASQAQVKFVGARLQSTASQSIANNTTTDLNYQTVVFDTGGMANLVGNNRILTANTAGLYLVLLEVGWPYESGSSGNRVAGIFQNSYGSSGGTQVSGDARMPIWAPVGGGGGGTPHTTNFTTSLLKANAGDFFSSAVSQGSGASQTVTDQSNTFLSAILLGA